MKSDNAINLEYNSQRGRMYIPEYGRNIQKMVNYAISVENRDERNRVAQAIIIVMGQLNPHLRDINDFKHKLWDHIFIISDFKLDVDSPYPKPTLQTFAGKPDKVKYPYNNIKYRFYGKTIELMIQKAIGMEDGELKNLLIQAIANHMKKSYINWNKENVSDDIIIKHLAELSNGKLKPDEEFRLNTTGDILARTKKKNESSGGGHGYGQQQRHGQNRNYRQGGGGHGHGGQKRNNHKKY
jgi:hypothetical protein